MRTPICHIVPISRIYPGVGGGVGPFSAILPFSANIQSFCVGGGAGDGEQHGPAVLSRFPGSASKIGLGLSILHILAESVA